ncbi:MAG: relaxase/mobilization nuclease domain-containing protein [Gemmatimonadota bacterium]
MIAVSSSGKSFRALAAYLAAGRNGDARDRVAWTASRNLPTDDPELAATFMRATASQSDRVEKPVYHVALSFDPSDAIDQPTMERVADRVLERLGLAGHQVVIVAHRDRQHPHLHLFVNRVHPETGKAWERWRDQPVIQQTLREIEREFGFREVPGRLAPPEERSKVLPEQAELPLHASAPAPAAGQTESRAAAGRVGQLARDLQSYVQITELRREQHAVRHSVEAARARLAQLEAARDRADAAEQAFLRGLSRVYRSPGDARQRFQQAVVEHGMEAALATLGVQPERFGSLVTVQRRAALGLYREVDDAAARHAARETVQLASTALAAERASVVMCQEANARRSEDTFMRELGRLYERPTAAKEVFEDLLRTRGAEAAVVAIQDRPDTLGSLRPGLGGDAPQLVTLSRAAAIAGREAIAARVAVGSIQSPVLERERDLSSLKAALEVARQDVEWLTRRSRAVEQGLERMPHVRALEYQLGKAVERLLPREIERLRQMVSAPQLALLKSARAAVRDAILGRDDERQR